MDNTATTFTFEPLADRIAGIAERHGVGYDASSSAVRFAAYYTRRHPGWRAASAAVAAAWADLAAVLRAEYAAEVSHLAAMRHDRWAVWGLFFDGDTRASGAAAGIEVRGDAPPPTWRELGEPTPHGYRRTR